MLTHFPLDVEPYEHQALVLGAFEEALKTDKKFLLLRAPTGSGKSAIALAAALSFKSRGVGTHLLISRRFLQQQYLDEFSRLGLANLWGKANYPCTRADVMGASPRTCTDCFATREKSPQRYIKLFCSSKSYGDLCPYIVAKNSAADATITMNNYESFLAHTHYSGLLKKRGLMIVDEAHALEDRLATFASVSISEKTLLDSEALATIPEADSGEPYATWLYSVIARKLDSQITSYARAAGVSEAEASKLAVELMQLDIAPSRTKSRTPSAKDSLMACLDLKSRLERVAGLIANNPDNWVCYKHLTPRGKVSSVEFKPVLLGGLSHRYLFDQADKVILISATLNSGPFLRGLGIRKSDVASYIDVASTFPLENRPIIVQYCGSMSYANKAATLPRIADKVDHIVGTWHPSQKGCVHTHSFSHTRALKELLPERTASRIIWHTQSSQSIESLLKEFYTSENMWIASPSCSEGLDGKGDRIRAQIIIKAPYGMVKDPRVAARLGMPDGRTWYSIDAQNTLLQAYGRGTRSQSDWSVTYVLDSSISDLVLRNRKHLPKWFLATWAKSDAKNWVLREGRWHPAG